MHLTVSTPGFWFVTLYMCVPESLSLRVTVPAANLLPVPLEFVVVLENAEKVAAPASAPAAPRTPTESRSFRCRFKIVLASLFGYTFRPDRAARSGMSAPPAPPHSPDRTGGDPSNGGTTSRDAAARFSRGRCDRRVGQGGN